MKFLRTAFVFACVALSGACSVIATNHLDLTVLDSETHAPVENYDVRVRLPKWYGNPYSPVSETAVEFYELDMKTNGDGRLSSDISVWYDYGNLFQTFSGVKKLMFFIDTAGIGKECSLVLWYIEDKDFFVPLKYQNGEIKNIPYAQDVTGGFKRHENKKGWDVNAVIRRMDRICADK